MVNGQRSAKSDAAKDRPLRLEVVMVPSGKALAINLYGGL